MFLKYIGEQQPGIYALTPNKYYHVNLKVTDDALEGTDCREGTKYILERVTEDGTIVSYVHFSIDEINRNWEAYEGFTKTTVIHKLVRDRIPEKIIHNDQLKEVPFYHKLTDKNEILHALEKKLDEEVKEFKECRDVEELADIVEVIYGILYQLEVDKKSFFGIVDRKRALNGGFKNGIVLDYTVTDEYNPNTSPVYYFVSRKEDE